MRRNRHLSRGAPDDRGHETASPAATQRAIAEHQIRFRAMNERIEAAAEANPGLGRLPFVCECPDPDCMDLVSLSFDEYEAVRQHPRRFFNTVGHEAISVAAGAETVVVVFDQFTIVEKVGLAGELAADAQVDRSREQ